MLPMPNIVPNRIKEWRLRRRFSQERLARAIDVSTRTLVRYENGERTPSVTLAQRMAHVLSVTVSDLYPLP